MNNFYAKRLFNVAKATLETQHPHEFSMAAFVDPIKGTPVCPLGQYSARPDLQSHFKIVGVLTKSYHQQFKVCFIPDANQETYIVLNGDVTIVAPYFGVTNAEAYDLFGGAMGCDQAQVPQDVYNYISNFLSKRGYDPKEHFL